MNTLFYAMVALSACVTTMNAQMLAPVRVSARDYGATRVADLRLMTYQPIVSRSRGTAGAIVGGIVGVTAGLIIGHSANVGCRLGDVKCSPEDKQVKAMIADAVILGAVGAGLGYLMSKLWPDTHKSTAITGNLRVARQLVTDSPAEEH
jgi:hypothetical protein